MTVNNIPFNKPYLHGRELVYIAQSVASGKISETVFLQKNAMIFLRKNTPLRKLY